MKKLKLSKCLSIIDVYFQSGWREALKTAYDGNEEIDYVIEMRKI